VKTKFGLRQFIPARAEDNPDLLRNDPLYLDRLEEAGNAALVRAWREGDWSVVAGAMFDSFRPTMGGRPWHVMQRAFAVPSTWEIWRGGDDAFGSPASIHWLTQDPRMGTIYVIREIYQMKLLPEQLAARIKAIDAHIKLDYGDGQHEYNDEELGGVMDSAAFSDVGTGRPGRAQQMNEHGCNWKPVEKGPGSRVLRVQLMHKMLAVNPRDPNGLPGIRFTPNCTEAIRTIPSVPVDPDNPDDIDTDSEDHAFDSVTYGCSRRQTFFGRSRVKGI
jgi:hypothetical protein